LRAQCQKLASLPGEIGRPRLDLQDGMRSFPFRGYVIFFRYAGERFEVVAILESHRDVGSHFER
jgi:toxin ParE1/3/4